MSEATAPPCDNPLLVVSDLPYRLPPFDRIRDEHFAPAFESGMAAHLAEIAAIADNPASPDFDNTIVALERSGALLTRARSVFFNRTASHTNPVLDALEARLAPELAAHSDAVFLNAALYARIRSLFERRETLGLDAESLRLLERYHRDFVRAGAQLSPADQARLRELNGELASLTTRFQQQLLGATNDGALIVEDRAELDGLSESEICVAADAARARGQAGRWLLPLFNTTGQPLLARLRNRALRERLFRASVARGSVPGGNDNRPIVARIVRLRAEQARLLGYANHAAYRLQTQTAQTPEAVNALLARLAPAAAANARREAAELQQLIDAQAAEGRDGFSLQAWDWAFYAEQLRKARYDIDESQMRDYFALDRVLHDGLFHTAGQLFGLRFEARPELPVYHPDVQSYEVFDADGQAIGLFLFDPYARDSKQGGAWMSEYVLQSTLLGTKPVVTNNLNVPRPPEGEPTLLSFDELTTAFHEFGHALHGLLSDVRYPMFSGTNVPRDFVEFPSQVNEMWATWPESLGHFARHHRTGEVMPTELVDKVLAAEAFNEGFKTSEYLACAVLDQAWHQIAPEQAPPPEDVSAFESAALARAGLDFGPVPPRYHSTYFSHVFAGGYSAGYYAYIWSEVLDAEAVEWFKEHGGLNRASGAHYRKHVLSKGGSAEAMDLYRNFLGRDPQIQPLLRRRGLDAAPPA